jgi:hypothetical protein
MEAIKIRQEYKPFNYFVKGGNVQELLECVDRAVEHYGYCLQSIDLQKRFYAALSR